nr:M1 family metallopeptidase [Bacteroidota bacterium]
MRISVFLLVLSLYIVGCNNTPKSVSPLKINAGNDPHSFSNFNDAIIKKLNLNLKVDFENKILTGFAEYDIENKTGGDKIIFDTQNLNIEAVYIDGNTKTDYVLGKSDSIIGTPLVVNIKPATTKVKIIYKTRPDAAAIQWLEPSQTHDKQFPFMFTQSEAILARTWIPIQDSPGIKFTYTATVTCPTNLMALMSAENDTVYHADGVYHFNMPQPVSSYLMALAIGHVQYHGYNAISGVYAEPGLLNACANELTDMPAMINAAGELYGPYAWGKYDLLVLPPSFPFGGMENPRLTFATPTIIAGDKSLVALVAHELAHSWSGNLVTNATWNDFWLNEGFTVYFENRIMEKIYGKPYADMLAYLGYKDLEETMTDLLEHNPDDTKLFLHLENRNPDDGMSDIAYEKGRLFLKNIEAIVGREKFDAFLKNYFEENKFKSMTTEMFLNHVRNELFDGDTAAYSKINARAWVYENGLPKNYNAPQSAILFKVQQDADAFTKSGNTAVIDTAGYSTHNWLQLIRTFDAKLGIEKLAALDKAFHFTQSQNSEIQCVWYILAIKNNYDAANAQIENFLCNVGRRKFVRPLFAALLETENGRAFAAKIYDKARPTYHAVTRETIDEMMANAK